MHLSMLWRRYYRASSLHHSGYTDKSKCIAVTNNIVQVLHAKINKPLVVSTHVYFVFGNMQVNHWMRNFVTHYNIGVAESDNQIATVLRRSVIIPIFVLNLSFSFQGMKICLLNIRKQQKLASRSVRLHLNLRERVHHFRFSPKISFIILLLM